MKVHAINVIRSRGISTKKNPKGTPYDIGTLQILTPFETGSGDKEDGSSWQRTGYGFQVTELPCRVDCIAEFASVKFPAVLEVQTDTDVVFGRMTTIVTGLSIPAQYSAAKAA